MRYATLKGYAAQGVNWKVFIVDIHLLKHSKNLQSGVYIYINIHGIITALIRAGLINVKER